MIEQYPNGWVVANQRTVLDEQQGITNPVPVPEEPSERPLYVLYSFAKTDGLLARIGRPYWLAGTDLDNQAFFKEFAGAEVIYRDAAGLLVKIR